MLLHGLMKIIIRLCSGRPVTLGDQTFSLGNQLIATTMIAFHISLNGTHIQNPHANFDNMIAFAEKTTH
jgi:hypothetical protein